MTIKNFLLAALIGMSAPIGLLAMQEEPAVHAPQEQSSGSQESQAVQPKQENIAASEQSQQDESQKEHSEPTQTKPDAKEEVNTPGQEQPQSEQQDQLPSEHGTTETTQTEQVESNPADNSTSSDSQCESHTAQEDDIEDTPQEKIADPYFRLVFGGATIALSVLLGVSPNLLFKNESDKLDYLKQIIPSSSVSPEFINRAYRKLSYLYVFAGVCSGAYLIKSELDDFKRAKDKLNEEAKLKPSNAPEKTDAQGRHQ